MMMKSSQGGRIALILSMAVIAFATLVPSGGGGRGPALCILCGERGLADFLSNIILFVPLGAALGLRRWSLLRSVLFGVLASLAVEIAQLGVIVGRTTSIGDVIANSTGATVGWLLWYQRPWWLGSSSNRLRPFIVAVGTAALLLAALMLFTPSATDYTWFVQRAGRPRNAPQLAGVESMRIGGVELQPRQRIEPGDTIRDMLFTRPLEITATRAPPRNRLSLIAGVADEERNRIMILGTVQSDLVYSYRMRADDLRLQRAYLRVADAFDNVPTGMTYDLTWAMNRRGYCIELNERRECGRGFTAGDTWSLLVWRDTDVDRRQMLRLVWMCLIFIPAGLLALRRTLPAVALATTFMLTAGPPLLGFAVTPLLQVLAAVAGIGIGSLISARYTRGRVQASAEHA